MTRVERVFLGFEPDADGRLSTAAPAGISQATWEEMRTTYRSIAAHDKFGRERCGWEDSGP